MVKKNRVGWYLLVLMLLVLAGCVANRPAGVKPVVQTTQPATLTVTQMTTQTATESATVTMTPTPTATRTPDPQSLACLPDNEWVLAKVVRVVDGDTIIAKIEGVNYRVRYIGVDTPETVHPSRPVEEFGKEASEMNTALVGGKNVYLIKDISEADQYDRLLRYVVADGFFVNYELIRTGFANVVTYPPDLACVRTFRYAQQDAMNEKAGLWAPRE